MGAEAWSLEPLESTIELRPDWDAPRLARWFLWSTAARQTLPPEMETASLLLSEVVSNAVRHGTRDAPILLTCRVEAEGVRVTARNHAPSFDARAPGRRGYGLQLVAALSRRWGLEPTEDGVEVWFEV